MDHFQEIDSVIQLHLQFSRFKNHHDITEILLKVALNTIKQTDFILFCIALLHPNPYVFNMD